MAMRNVLALFGSTLFAANGWADAPHLDDALVAKSFPMTTSVYVEIGGKPVLERYFPGGGLDVLNDTRSVTKTLVTLAAGLALRDKRLKSLDTPLTDLLKTSSASDPRRREVTLRDAMTMSSALDCDDNEAASPGNEDRMHEQSAWVAWGMNLGLRKDYARDASGRGPFRYCTINAVLAGHAIAAAVGRPIQDYLQTELFGPLGIEKVEWSFSKTGEAMTGGGTRLSTRDLAKLGSLFLNDGKWNGAQILPKGFAATAMTPYRDGNGQRYGLLIWRHAIPTDCGEEPFWYLGGNGGNAVVIVERLKLVAVITRTRYNTDTMWMETGRLLSQYVFNPAACLGTP